MRGDPFPADLEKQLNEAGVYFKPVSAEFYILEDRRQRPFSYRGTNEIWRNDPSSIRNFFHSKLDAYIALKGERPVEITLE